MLLHMLLKHKQLMPFMFLYLDPGTGSLLFSVVMGLVTTAFFIGKSLYYKAVSKTLSIFGKEGGFEDEVFSLVMYSEGKQYFSSFQPLLREVNRRKLPCTFLTSDPDDPGLEQASETIRTKFIGAGHKAWGFLNNMKADLCLMTTPGLDVLQIKRSKGVKHYSHFIHSPTDKAFNKPYSFDYFDSVLVCGNHQKRTIKFLEELRGTHSKDILNVGCVYYDYLVERKSAVKEAAASTKKKTAVLVAPTWGQNGLLRKYGVKVLKPMLDAGLNVVVRPHPQSFISEPELIEDLKRSLSDYRNLTWDVDRDPMAAMASSDVMLSDISGIIFDYVFLYEKPVLTVEFRPDKRGMEANDIPYEPWELTILETIGKQLKEDDFNQLPAIVASFAGNSEHKEAIRQLRQQSVVNFGDAASATVNTLEEILARVAGTKSGVAAKRKG